MVAPPVSGGAGHPHQRFGGLLGALVLGGAVTRRPGDRAAPNTTHRRGGAEGALTSGPTSWSTIGLTSSASSGSGAGSESTASSSATSMSAARQRSLPPPRGSS